MAEMVSNVVNKSETVFTNYILPAAGFAAGYFIAPVLLTPLGNFLEESVGNISGGKSLDTMFGPGRSGMKLLLGLCFLMAGFAMFKDGMIQKVIALALLGMAARSLIAGFRNEKWSA